jgi:hypothetical protein
MNKILIIAASACLLRFSLYADDAASSATNAVPESFSHPGKLGVGLTVGEPTGLTAKYWLNDTLALDGAAGWSFHPHADFYLQSDVLWHDFNLIPVPQGRLPVYFGVGGLVRFRDSQHDNEVGVRAPVGLSYMFDSLPVDVFAEVAPATDIAPSVRFELTGGVGIRYWF